MQHENFPRYPEPEELATQHLKHAFIILLYRSSMSAEEMLEFAQEQIKKVHEENII